MNKFTPEIFLNCFENINQITSFEFLDCINRLDKEKKKIVLTNDVVINKLKNLLKDSCVNEYAFYKKIANGLELDDIFKIFDANFIKDFYNSNKMQNLYRFFFSLCKKDINKVVEYMLKDDKYFLLFIKHLDKYNIPDLSYEYVIKILKKIETNQITPNMSFLYMLDKDKQYDLLLEEFNDNFFVNIIKNLKFEVQQYFYLEDKRFEYLFNRFDILNLVNLGYKFSINVISKKEFFDSFKCNSMVNFRVYINKFTSYQVSNSFVKKITKYEDELINYYDFNSGLFKQYKDLLDNIDILNNKFIINLANNKFIYDRITLFKIREYINYDKKNKPFITNKEELVCILKKISTQKLNEIIIDRLFKDNIYNVFLNIKELVRYHESLDDNEKVLDEYKINLYNTILNIDKLDSKNIINLYNRLKRMDIENMFYYDLQKVKHLSYEKIKKNLFVPENNMGDIHKGLSNKYGVKVFDLRNKKYFILARAISGCYNNITRNKRDCYTLLSDENSHTMQQSYLYGYSDFDNNSILHVFESDSFSADTINDSLSVGTSKVNRIMTPKEIVTNSYWYSEIQIINKKNGNNFITLKPSFLIVYDKIDKDTLNEAKRLNIPICIISNKLTREFEDKISYNEELDDYIDSYCINNYDEEVKRIHR